mgnify:CR=1 FL=1
MMEEEINAGLEYNTQREKLAMPEYGRNVLQMVQNLKTIEDRDKRNAQAKAIIKTMEILKQLGISSAMRWLVIVVHYSLRGVMDNVQDRIEGRIWL